MLNNRKHLFFIVMMVCLAACKSSTVVFRYDKNVNFEFFKDVPKALPEVVNGDIDSIKVYRSIPSEKLLECDAILEFKIINSESRQERVPHVVSKNYHYLYLMQVFTKPQQNQDTICVFLSTSYTPDGLCTAIGPAYVGYIYMN